MKKIALIPARYAATRFPAKLLQPLGNKSVIRTTYENTVATQLFDEVFVVTDSDLIFDEIVAQGGKAIRSVKEHESGSDRIAEAVENLDVDIVVNVQGDEPFIDRDSLSKVIDVFRNDVDGKIDLASLMREIKDENDINNPNNVKVVVDQNGMALYFSRSVIPYPRERNVGVRYFQHIGIYGFKKETLLHITKLPQSPLEKIEKLENLRMLENGLEIFLDTVQQVGIAIDTPEDFIKATLYLQKKI